MIDLGSGGVRVKLTDFGIARMTEDDTMTATGSILGSPSYMSPEQAKSGEIGPASDVFSLGVTLYQMATGRTPFPGKDPLTVIAALVGGEFLRPAQVDARVGPELETVILRCLKRAPGERYADGRAAAVALRELADATAARLGGEDAALRAFHADPATFARAVGGPIADDAATRARAAIRRGELTKALAQISRALAYAPGHRGAEALLATLSSRRRWAKIGAVAAALLVAGGAAAGVRAWRRGHAAPSSVVAAVLPAPAPPPPEPRAPAPAAPTAVAEAARAPSAQAGAAPVRAPRSKRERGKQAIAARATATSAAAPGAETVRAPEPPSAPAAAAAPSSPTATSPPATVAQEAPPARAAPAPTAGITLRAREGFCSPSLDDRPPALRPIYEGVAVGPHVVYCTRPGRAREQAGTYDLRAGTHPDLVILPLPGSDGRPTLGRLE
jgi:Protein kinase domain